MIQDIKLALRLRVKSPGFSAVAIRALGIGANTAIFSFLNAFFLRALPVRQPQELVTMFTADERAPRVLPDSNLNLQDYRSQNQVFSGMLALGAYRLMSDTVSKRRHEIGMALGAQRHQVLSLVMRQGLQPVAFGLSVGSAAAVATAQHFRSLLYYTAALDPTILAGAALLFLAVAALACLLPVARVVRTDPFVALHSE